jgi:hypothetical protein
LEAAKAELERILRQLREEEVERMLALLEGRFRKMLEAQIRIYDDTVQLDRVPDDEKDARVPIPAGRLATEERKLVVEADRALNLLLDEGSSIAFPETVSQLRDDMQQVAERLDAANVGRVTQGIEEDIIASLEEMIEALAESQKDMEEQRLNPPQMPPGDPGSAVGGRDRRVEDDPRFADAGQHADEPVRSVAGRHRRSCRPGDRSGTGRCLGTAGRAAGADLSDHSRPCVGQEPIGVGTPMAIRISWRMLAGAVGGVVRLGIEPVLADETLEQRASWQQPTRAEVKQAIDAWLADQELDELTLARLDVLWSEEAAGAFDQELLDLLVETIAIVQPDKQAVIEWCLSPQATVAGTPLRIPGFRRDLSAGPQSSAVVPGPLAGTAGAVRRVVGADPGDRARTGARSGFAAVLPGVGYHRMLQRDDCLRVLGRLLENKGQIPRRYETVAMLMESDIKPLQADSLDEIARLMDDIERRLGFGRAGTRVREQEDEVIAKLDKMIEELEQQMQQQAGSSEQRRRCGFVADGRQSTSRRKRPGRRRSAPTRHSSQLGQSAAEGAPGSPATNRQRSAVALPRSD